MNRRPFFTASRILLSSIPLSYCYTARVRLHAVCRRTEFLTGNCSQQKDQFSSDRPTMIIKRTELHPMTTSMVEKPSRPWSYNSRDNLRNKTAVHRATGSYTTSDCACQPLHQCATTADCSDLSYTVRN